MTGDINKLKIYYLHNIGLIVQTLYPVIIAIIIFSDIFVDVFLVRLLNLTQSKKLFLTVFLNKGETNKSLTPCFSLVFISSIE